MRIFLVSLENLDTVMDDLRSVVKPLWQGAVHCVTVDAGVILVSANASLQIESTLSTHKLVKDYTPVVDYFDDEDDATWVPWEEQQARREASYKFYDQLRGGLKPTLLHPRSTGDIRKFGVKPSAAVIREERFSVSDAPLVRNFVGEKFFAPAEVQITVTVSSGERRESNYSIWIWAERTFRDQCSVQFRGDLRSLSNAESFKAPAWLLPHVLDLAQSTRDVFAKAGLAGEES